YDYGTDAAAASFRATEFAAIETGSAWTENQLRLSIRKSLVLGTSETTINIEDPNIIAAGDVVITSANGVGDLSDDFVFTAGEALTEDAILALATSERQDITYLDANGVEITGDAVDFNDV